MEIQENQIELWSESGSTTRSTRVGFSGLLVLNKRNVNIKRIEEEYVETTLDVQDDLVSVLYIQQCYAGSCGAGRMEL